MNPISSSQSPEVSNSSIQPVSKKWWMSTALILRRINWAVVLGHIMIVTGLITVCNYIALILVRVQSAFQYNIEQCCNTERKHFTNLPESKEDFCITGIWFLIQNDRQRHTVRITICLAKVLPESEWRAQYKSNKM